MTARAGSALAMTHLYRDGRICCGDPRVLPVAARHASSANRGNACVASTNNRKRSWTPVTSMAMTVLTLALTVPGLAQDHYPSRLLTIVVPITAGTTIDILARLYGEALSRRSGQQVVIANRPGAGGLIGAQAVASAAADGYTVLLANSGHAILGTLNKNLPFDPVSDFAGVSLIADAPSVVNVAPALGVR
ncbi:MAG: hypothetical protein E6G96_12250, partial [Alphaproteobacteria bacterium]